MVIFHSYVNVSLPEGITSYNWGHKMLPLASVTGVDHQVQYFRWLSTKSPGVSMKRPVAITSYN